RAGGAGPRGRRARLRGEAHRFSGPRARGPRGPARRAIPAVTRHAGAEAVAARAASVRGREGGVWRWRPRPARLVNPSPGGENAMESAPRRVEGTTWNRRKTT